MARRAARLAPEVRREEILAAALARFAKGGYHATTMDDIARAAGLSKGALYWHFANKRELFLSLIQSLFRDFEREVVSPPEGRSARARLEHIARVVQRADPGAEGQAELMAELMARVAHDEELRTAFRDEGKRALKPITEAIEYGLKRGEFADLDPEAAALVLAAIGDGLLAHQLVRPDLDVNAVFHQGVELLIRGMEARR